MDDHPFLSLPQKTPSPSSIFRYSDRCSEAIFSGHWNPLPLAVWAILLFSRGFLFRRASWQERRILVSFSASSSAQSLHPSPPVAWRARCAAPGRSYSTRFSWCGVRCALLTEIIAGFVRPQRLFSLFVGNSFPLPTFPRAGNRYFHF